MQFVRLVAQGPAKTVGMKLFLIFFICIVSMVSAVGFYSYSQSKQIIETKMALSINKTIDQASSKIDLMTKNYEELSMQFLADKMFLTLLDGFRKTTDNYEKFKSHSDIQDQLRTLQYTRNDLVAVTIVPLYDDKVISTGSTTMEWTDFQKEDWLKPVVDGDGRAVWLSTKKNGFINDTNSVATFAVGRAIGISNTSDKEYALIMEFRANTLKTLNDILISDSSKVFVVDPNNALIFSEDAEAVGKPWNIELSAAERSSSVDQSVAKTILSDGENMLVSYKKVGTTGWTIAMTVPVAELVKDSQSIFDATIISIILAALIAAAIGVMVIMMIGKPLMRLRNLMKKGAQGDLTVRSKARSKDEIGQLSESFDQMMEQITELVSQTNASAAEVLATAEQLLTSSKQTATSAKEISIATEEIAHGASSLAVEAEKGSHLTTDIGYKVQSVVEANVQMGEAASEVHTATLHGVTYMKDLNQKTNAAEQITRSMVDKVGELKASTASIKRILDMLNGMTKQTNILSLNATIEASRAGTAGKGFMVVADEIRNLAEQSRQSIDEVDTITAKILGQIEETLAVMAEAYPLFQAQNQSVKDAETVFNQVQTQMAEFASNLAGVQSSVENLNEAQLILSETMTNVSAVSEQSSATSQEVASLSGEQLSVSENLVRLSERLEQLSDSLRDTLKTFRMKEEN